MKIIKNANFSSDYNIYYPKDLSFNIKDDSVIYNEKTIISLNRIYHDSDLSMVEDFLKSIKNETFFGIIFSDYAVYEIAKSYDLVDKLIYDPNTLITNYEDFNFFADLGIMGAFVSPFVTLEDLKIIGEKKKLKLFFFGYGHLNMFYSRRPLITNFFLFNNEENKYLNKVLYLNEETREERYPIIEKNGEVVVYSPYIFSCLDQEDILKDFVDYLYIDNSLDDESPITDGFLHKKTVYRRK